MSVIGPRPGLWNQDSHSTSNGSGMSSYIKSAMQYPLRYEADFCFGCSEEAGRWLFGNKVLNSNKYFMLKNAIDLNKYQISVEIRKKYRNEWNIDDSSRVFMHVGRLHEATIAEKVFRSRSFQDCSVIISGSIDICVGMK